MVHVLVADDDPDICALITLQVTRMGFTVTSVGDGLAALDAIEQHTFDLAVLDVAMPGATGLAVTAMVRSVDPHHELPIILMSAFSTVDDVQRGLDAGADLYVTKPLSLKDLRSRINSLL